MFGECFPIPLTQTLNPKTPKTPKTPNTPKTPTPEYRRLHLKNTGLLPGLPSRVWLHAFGNRYS